jgi:hypothetical protein
MLASINKKALVAVAGAGAGVVAGVGVVAGADAAFDSLLTTDSEVASGFGFTKLSVFAIYFNESILASASMLAPLITTALLVTD